MKVSVYAVLKDFFDKEFTVDEPVHTVRDLKNYLIKCKPEAKNILAISRFAINDIFVNNSFELQQNDSIHIIPPSSGG